MTNREKKNYQPQKARKNIKKLLKWLLITVYLITAGIIIAAISSEMDRKKNLKTCESGLIDKCDFNIPCINHR